MNAIEGLHLEQLRQLNRISEIMNVNLDLLNKFDLIKELDKTINSEIILNNLFLTSQLIGNIDQKERTRYLIFKTKKLRKEILTAMNRKLVY